MCTLSLCIIGLRTEVLVSLVKTVSDSLVDVKGEMRVSDDVLMKIVSQKLSACQSIVSTEDAEETAPRPGWKSGHLFIIT